MVDVQKIAEFVLALRVLAFDIRRRRPVRHDPTTMHQRHFAYYCMQFVCKLTEGRRVTMNRRLYVSGSRTPWMIERLSHETIFRRFKEMFINTLDEWILAYLGYCVVHLCLVGGRCSKMNIGNMCAALPSQVGCQISFRSATCNQCIAVPSPRHPSSSFTSFHSVLLVPGVSAGLQVVVSLPFELDKLHGQVRFHKLRNAHPPDFPPYHAPHCLRLTET
jgi:hypothetical protein